VTNKTKLSEPRHPPLAEQALCHDPIDGPTTKPTTPQVYQINQLRVSYSTLIVVLLSRVVSQRIGPYGEALEKPPEPPKMPQDHNYNHNESLYHKVILIMFIDVTP
jgi:hypothetical protein